MTKPADIDVQIIEAMRVVYEIYVGAFAPNEQTTAFGRIRADGIVEIYATDPTFEGLWRRYGVDLAAPGNIVEEESIRNIDEQLPQDCAELTIAHLLAADARANNPS